MLRSWALSLAGILGIGISLAYVEASSLLLKESQWEQGKKHLNEGRAKEAKEIFQALTKKYPKEPDLYLFLGIASLRLREVQEAESHVRRVVKLDPDHAEGRTLLGWIHLEVRRDFRSAIDEYATVVRLKPGVAEAYNNLGVAFKKNGDLEEAIENFTLALGLRVDYSEAWSNRGWVYAQKKKWGEAKSDFEQALRINPQDQGALYGLSHVLKEGRDYAGADKALRSLLTQSPNFVYWLEWGQLQLVRYYWVLLSVAAAFFLHAQYRKVRRRSHGG